MRTVPERPLLVHVVVVFGGFLAGPYFALRLGAWLTPDSDLVQTVAVFAFALVFAGGTTLWMGLGVATVVARGLWALLRGRRPGPEGLRADRQLVPTGYRAYAVLGVVGGLLVGLLAGLATELSVALGVAAWGGLGLAYGTALSLAAHHGWLPFPEPE